MILSIVILSLVATMLIGWNLLLSKDVTNIKQELGMNDEDL